MLEKKSWSENLKPIDNNLEFKLWKNIKITLKVWSWNRKFETELSSIIQNWEFELKKLDDKLQSLKF